MDTTRERYLEALLSGDRRTATQLVQDAVSNNMSVRDIYLEVFQPAQRRLGELWETNQITVAQEHFATAVTQLCMSLLYPQIFTTEKIGRRLVATCVGGELHEIGVRMVADFFEMDGWDTYYLGASAPSETVIMAAVDEGADVLAVSTSMTFNIPEVTQLIRSARESVSGDGPLILVGGRPFNADPELWRTVGADLSAPDAESAVRVVTEALSVRAGRARDE